MICFVICDRIWFIVSIIMMSWFLVWFMCLWKILCFYFFMMKLFMVKVFFWIKCWVIFGKSLLICVCFICICGCILVKSCFLWVVSGVSGMSGIIMSCCNGIFCNGIFIRGFVSWWLIWMGFIGLIWYFMRLILMYRDLSGLIVKVIKIVCLFIYVGVMI